MGVKKACIYIHDELGHPTSSDDLYTQIEAEMYEEYQNNIGTKPFVMEFLKKLKSQGVKMCILSASTGTMIEASAKRCGFGRYMEFIQPCENLGKPKSDPETYLIIAEAYAKAGKTFELHIYPDAPHGAALGNAITANNNPKYDNPQIAKWIDDAAKWTKTI